MKNVNVPSALTVFNWKWNPWRDRISEWYGKSCKTPKIRNLYTGAASTEIEVAENSVQLTQGE